MRIHFCFALLLGSLTIYKQELILLKVNVKKTLAKYGYSPDQQALVTDMVLEQAKRYGNEWSYKRATYDTGGGASLLD